MDLFKPKVKFELLHPIVRMLLLPENEPERNVITSWANGFLDRDNKFVHEFQTTFESSFWELYIHAVLKELGGAVDFSHATPDFVAHMDCAVCIEATIAAPPQGGLPPVGFSSKDIPDDFDDFNRESILRICNSLSSKIKKYRTNYCNLQHVADKPYVIALASFDRPLSHFAANRGIVAALYGVYFDEAETIRQGVDNLIRYPISHVAKSETSDISVGYFTEESYNDVSAVIYSSTATWGKVRALADKPESLSMFRTFHPPAHGLSPVIRQTQKRDYLEHLIDGLHVFHNPFATHPLNRNTFEHERLAQYFVTSDGDLDIVAPDDFLLLRTVNTVTTY